MRLRRLLMRETRKSVEFAPLRLPLRRFAELPGLAAAVAVACSTGPAHGQGMPTVGAGASASYIGVALSTAYDSNVTRQPSGPGVVGSAVDTAGLLANFDHTYERQRVHASADVERDVDTQMPLYDLTTQLLSAGLQSSFPADVTTDIKLSRSVQLAHQSDFSVIERDVMTQNRVDTWLRFPLAPQWHGVLTAGAGKLRNSYGADIPTDLDSVQFEAGVRYQTGAENYVDFLARSVQATYPDAGQTVFANTAYHDRGADLRMKWRFSGSSELLGRIGYLQRRDKVMSARDFSGPSYDLTYLWTPWTKIRVLAYALRAIGEPGDSDYLAAVTHTYRIAPDYQATERIRLGLELEWSRIRYYSDLLLAQPGQLSPPTSRDDIVSSAGVGVHWNPRRWLQLHLEWLRQERTSTAASWDFVDRLSRLQVQAQF